MTELLQKIPKGTSKKELRRWLAATRAMLLEARRRHECQPEPDLGTLRTGGMNARITAVEFHGRRMHVSARIPQNETGPVGGRWEIYGSDGSLCCRSNSASPDGYFGIKTALAVWELDFDTDLRPDGGWPSDEQAAANWPGSFQAG